MSDHQGCKLAIVGSRDVPAYQSESIIKAALSEHKPAIVISGGAGGVDQQAVKIAAEMGYTTLEFWPRMPAWDAPEHGEPQEQVTATGMIATIPGGFKTRNIKIAEACDCLVRISSATTKTYGSGWTADYAEKIGKNVIRHTA